MPSPMKNRISIINVSLLLASLAMLTFGVHMLTQAQAQPVPGQTAAPSPDDVKCIAEMQDFMRDKKIEFGTFINEHFRSEKPTSELIPVAVERFRQYREEVRERIAEFLPANRAEASAALAEGACQTIVDRDFLAVKSLLRQHILSNAYAKKSTRLIDKYKEINAKLQKLNFTIAQMYGYFASFSQKLPCYATKCVKG